MKIFRRAESNEVAQELTLTQLSTQALVAGIPLGFNGAEAVYFIDTRTLEGVIEITWGDQALMRSPRLRTPQAWALSYDEQEPCTRSPMILVLPSTVLSESCEALNRRFTAFLLELAQDPVAPPRAHIAESCAVVIQSRPR